MYFCTNAFHCIFGMPDWVRGVRGSDEFVIGVVGLIGLDWILDWLLVISYWWILDWLLVIEECGFVLVHVNFIISCMIMFVKKTGFSCIAFMFMCLWKLGFHVIMDFGCVCITTPSRDGVLSRWSSSGHSGAEYTEWRPLDCRWATMGSDEMVSCRLRGPSTGGD